MSFSGNLRCTVQHTLILSDQESVSRITYLNFIPTTPSLADGIKFTVRFPICKKCEDTNPHTMSIKMIPAATAEDGHSIADITVRMHARKLSSGTRPTSMAGITEEEPFVPAKYRTGGSQISSDGNGSDDEKLITLRRWLEASNLGHSASIACLVPLKVISDVHLTSVPAASVTSPHSEPLTPTDSMDSHPVTPPDAIGPLNIQTKGKAKELDGLPVPRLVLPGVATLPAMVPPHQATHLSHDMPAITNVNDDQFAEDIEVLPSLTAADIRFTVENAQQEQPSLKQLRERIVKQYPQLVSAPEPVVKPRKAHEPPPAVDTAVRARFKQTTQAEKDARELSLVLKVDEETELSVIRGIVVLESRQGRWEKVADPAASTSPDFAIPELTDLPVLPSAWLLPIDTAKFSSQHKTKSKKTFELPDYRVIAPCWECHGETYISCYACAGVAADECFWCEGSGERRGKPCEGCGGQRVHECRTCSNKGRLACTHCDLTGKVHATYVVDVKLRTIELPPIRVNSLVSPHIPGPPPRQEDIMECARAKMAASVSRLFEEQARKPVPAVPVLARCIWSKTVQRVVSVWRPYQIPKSIRRRMSSADKLGKAMLPDEKAATPDIAEGLGTDRDGELRRFVVPCDPSAPVIELQHEARACAHSTSQGHSRRTSTADSTTSDSPLPSPAHSFTHIGNFWRHSVARARSGSLISPMEDTPLSSVPPSPGLSATGGTAAVSASASRRPSVARLSTAPAAAHSMPPSPLRLSHDSGIKDPSPASPIRRLRSASIVALVSRRRNTVSDVAVGSGSHAHVGAMRQALPTPTPLTPAGPVTWSRRKSSAVAPSMLGA